VFLGEKRALRTARVPATDPEDLPDNAFKERPDTDTGSHDVLTACIDKFCLQKHLLSGQARDRLLSFTALSICFCAFKSTYRYRFLQNRKLRLCTSVHSVPQRPVLDWR
jgi:hypothetical protein